MDTKHKILFLVLVTAVALSTVTTYYRYVVIQDFEMVIDESDSEVVAEEDTVTDNIDANEAADSVGTSEVENVIEINDDRAEDGGADAMTDSVD